MEQYAKNIVRAEAAAKDYDDRLKTSDSTPNIWASIGHFRERAGKVVAEFKLVGEAAAADFIGPVNEGLKRITDDATAIGAAFGTLKGDARLARS